MLYDKKALPLFRVAKSKYLLIVLSHLFFFLAYCTYLYNNGSLCCRPGVLRAPGTSDSNREPLGPYLPSFSKSSLPGAAG